MKNLLVILLLFNLYSFQAQKKTKLKIKNFRVAYLDDSIKETSGLCFFNKSCLTFNDGGNTSMLYELNQSDGKISSSKLIPVPNQDWEAITTDSTSIFVGDFGNNLGARKDLCIYKIQFYDNSVVPQTSKIEFLYSNQSDFFPRNLKHDFDAEAMIYLEGNIHLFSKEWLSKKTSHYIIDPNSTTKQSLKPTEEFKTKFMVTDATYFDQTLYLVGYTKSGRTYLMVFSKDSTATFFSSKPRKYKLGSLLTIGQIEGITVNKEGIYISGEGISNALLNIKPTLYFIPHSVFKNIR